jgi:hypothetical protein
MTFLPPPSIRQLDSQRAIVGANRPTEFPVRSTLLVDFPAVRLALVNASAVLSRLRGVRQPERSQRNARDADAESFQRPAPRDGLGHVLGQFIEFVVHNYPFVLIRCYMFIVLCVHPFTEENFPKKLREFEKILGSV